MLDFPCPLKEAKSSIADYRSGYLHRNLLVPASIALLILVGGTVGDVGQIDEKLLGPDDKSMIPREKLFWEGRESLSDQELLTIFLSIGLPGLSVLQLATRLLVQFDGLRGLMQVDGEEILKQPGVGVAKYA